MRENLSTAECDCCNDQFVVEEGYYLVDLIDRPPQEESVQLPATKERDGLAGI